MKSLFPTFTTLFTNREFQIPFTPSHGLRSRDLYFFQILWRNINTIYKLYLSNSLVDLLQLSSKLQGCWFLCAIVEAQWNAVICKRKTHGHVIKFKCYSWGSMKFHYVFQFFPLLFSISTPSILHVFLYKMLPIKLLNILFQLTLQR